MSSLVPAASKTSSRTPELLEAVRAGRVDRPGSACTTSSRTAAQRPLGDRVEVADDDVGLQPELEQGVGATVDTDEDGRTSFRYGRSEARSSR